MITYPKKFGNHNAQHIYMRSKTRDNSIHSFLHLMYQMYTYDLNIVQCVFEDLIRLQNVTRVLETKGRLLGIGSFGRGVS
jgi:hypothetical protein